MSFALCQLCISNEGVRSDLWFRVLLVICSSLSSFSILPLLPDDCDEKDEKKPLRIALPTFLGPGVFLISGPKAGRQAAKTLTETSTVVQKLGGVRFLLVLLSEGW